MYRPTTAAQTRGTRVAALSHVSYPVQVSVHHPDSYDRAQILLRILVWMGLGWLGLSGGLVYVLIPAVAGVMISTRGTEQYRVALGPKLWRGIEWLLALWAYLLLVTDRFPLDHERDVRADVQITSNPTLGSALLRLVTALPSAVVLALLDVVSCLLALIAAVTILVDRRVPSSIVRFQEGVLRWHARLAAYLASLVDEYPPFSFERDELEHLTEHQVS